MTELLERPQPTAGRAGDDREGLDRHLEGLARRDLPRPDHGQRRAHGRHRGRPLLHVLRPRHDPQGPPATIKVATVGNPGMHLPTWVGALPGFSALATKMMQRQMEKLDIPPIPEFIELIADSGARLYACKASVDMFGLTMDDFVPQVETSSPSASSTSFAAGGQIVFTSRRLDAGYAHPRWGACARRIAAASLKTSRQTKGSASATSKLTTLLGADPP